MLAGLRQLKQQKQSNLVNGRIGKLKRQLCRLDVEGEHDEVWRLDQVRTFRNDRVLRGAHTLDAVPRADKNLNTKDFNAIRLASDKH
jgi:hypothetical protein